MLFRNRYSERLQVTADPVGESMTQQSFKNECDINYVFNRYVKEGSLPPDALNRRQGIFADVSEVGDLQEALATVAAANEGFMTFSAKVRERFGNDPVQLLAFALNPANAEEWKKLQSENVEVVSQGAGETSAAAGETSAPASNS